MTTGVRDASGYSIGVAEGFRRFRHDLAHDPDRYYRRALLSAEWAVGRAVDLPHGVEVAALSVFTTQTATHIMERIRDAVQAAPAPVIDFGVGPSGSRAVFSVASLQSVTFNAHIAASGPLTPQPLANFIVNMNTVPGAVATVAFGRFTALDFTTHPSGHIAPDRDAHRHARADRHGRRRRHRLAAERPRDRRPAGPSKSARTAQRQQELLRLAVVDRQLARHRRHRDQRDGPRQRAALNDGAAAHRRHDRDGRGAGLRL